MKRASIGGKPRGPITESDYEIRDTGHDSPCWIWIGRNVDNPDYGKLRDNGVVRYAHVVAYEQRVGSIPDGLQLDHLCRVKRCIRPDHLEVVTGAENVRRGSHVRLSYEAVREIRESTESVPTLAARFGVHVETVRYVRSGHTWK